jgi:Ca2+/Na+ antiporter
VIGFSSTLRKAFFPCLVLVPYLNTILSYLDCKERINRFGFISLASFVIPMFRLSHNHFNWFPLVKSFTAIFIFRLVVHFWSSKSIRESLVTPISSRVNRVNR